MKLIMAIKKLIVNQPILITILLAFVGYLVTWKMDRAEARYNLQVAYYEKISSALTAAREQREIAGINCTVHLNSTENTSDQANFKEEHLKAMYAIIKAANISPFVFGQEVDSAIADYVTWFYSLKDYCADGAVPLSVFAEKEASLKSIIEKSITN